MVNEYIEPRSALSVLRQVLLQTGVTVTARITDPIAQAGCIRISRIGGGMRNLVTDEAFVAIQVYAPDDFTAEELCNKCRAYLRQSQFSKHGPGWVRYWRESGGPVEFADPDVQGFVRWQITGILGVSTH